MAVPLAVMLLTASAGPAAGDAHDAPPLRSDPLATSARTVYLTEKAHLHLVGRPGVEFTEEGQGSGTYSGSVTIQMTLSGTHVKAKYTAHSSHGTITGSATGSVVGSVTQPAVHFIGVLSIVRGTGGFAHASGSLQIRGAITRSSYALEEETRGNMHV